MALVQRLARSAAAAMCMGLMLYLPAAGSPLDTASCDKATAEKETLADVREIIERGPEWAKAHAPPATLLRIERWIELDEVLSFRCGRGRITAEAQRAAAAAELIENPPPPPAADATKPKDAVVISTAPAAPPEPATPPEAAATAAPAAVDPPMPAAAAAAGAAAPPVSTGAPAVQPPPEPAKPKPKAKSKPKTAVADAPDPAASTAKPKRVKPPKTDAIVPLGAAGQ